MVDIVCKACGQKIATQLPIEKAKPLLREGIVATWQAKNYWVAVTIHRGKFFYAGAENEPEARKRLDKLLKRPLD